MEINEKILEKYAKVAVTMGVNVQKGQTLILNTSIDAVPLTRAVVKAAYEAGAKQVQVNYGDDIVSQYHYTYQDLETLKTVPQWLIDSKLDYMKDGTACMLRICSDVPGILKDVDGEKLGKAMQARAAAMKELNAYTMANKIQWSIVAAPNAEWAKQVFPKDDEETAVSKLWDAILHAMRIDEENDPIAAWDEHNRTLAEREQKLNDMKLKKLHFTNGRGTDLTIEIPDDGIWAGGNEKTTSGIVFNPNMPTEEIFTMPYKYGVNGTVYASKPLDYNGKLIDDFWFTFKDGKVVDYGAKQEPEALKSLVEFDEGSCYLGEVALVPYESPISLSNILFLNTLFDENASCHLALGKAYPMNIVGGTEMSDEELAAHGVNLSDTHVDFMFGTADMKITGIDQNGKEIPIFHSGNFVF
ncbi:aminopeptidase [Clostridiaceae bacterium DONG20-135]|uniref:Aminopeptidase n=1 Tax=Copranaerobaculum intestinale TaxID=2692629 RepID=A0A6N8U7N7_9FIRM|nr:aminopeptidase [Copranaerobaculum intestinale]MXQ73344.1 aminopeptidase [Copranaerobaculum intestinale]